MELPTSVPSPDGPAAPPEFETTIDDPVEEAALAALHGDDDSVDDWAQPPDVLPVRRRTVPAWSAR